MVYKMLTFFVEQSQVDNNFTLNELLEFSRREYIKAVVIRKFATLENGVVSYLS